MSIKHLAVLKIPIPPPETQGEIVRKINEMERKCRHLESVLQTKINDLDELKKSILQKAFSGELTNGKGIDA
jgi:type I restriction enzyme S subunit